jgi:3-methyl-2-oxobutanoate hydroxymethyltransferase
VPAKVARLISEQLTIPTIGIGAGAGCDGQILLCYDLLGVFVKEVKEGTFPDNDHSYTVNEAEYEKFAAMVAKRRQV